MGQITSSNIEFYILGDRGKKKCHWSYKQENVTSGKYQNLLTIVD